MTISSINTGNAGAKRAANRHKTPAPDEMMDAFGTDWGFDIYKVHDVHKRDVSIVARFLIKKYKFNKLLNFPKKVSRKFFKRLEAEYIENPYHNSRHACDVTNSFLYIVENSQMNDIVTVIELFSGIIAALAHDVRHPGLTNRFLVMTKHKLANRYND
jgi:hypothetical protein